MPTLVAPTVPPNTTWSSTSPNGQWRAHGSVEFSAQNGSEKYHTQFKIVRTDGSVTWVVVDKWLPFQPGYTTPQPLHWSEDGKALYFTDLPHLVGCSVFVNGQDLERVDLKTGRVTEIAGKVGIVLALSPDEKTLVYIPDEEPPTLVFRDLATGAERRVKLEAENPDTQAGSLAWSPDSTVLVLTLAVHPCDPVHWLHSVVRVEVATLQQQTLIRNSPRYLRTVGWRTPVTVELENGQGNFVLMDALTGGSPTQ